ncbi:hypothetical protein [Micromonospora sp. NPDC047134]
MTLIANYVPLQLPSGGPNFFESPTPATCTPSSPRTVRTR